MVLFVALAVPASRAWAQQQQPYDEDDEEALARQQYAAQAEAQAQQAQQFGYVGVHPIPYENGSGFCYQTGAHFHEYPPFDQYLFRESGGWFYFIGDVGDFGYNQQVWGYNGNHPIPAEWGGGYCYIGWAHRHPYAPPPRLAFNFVGGYYVYGGGWDPGYWAGRDRYLGYYGGYYRSNYYGGRYYTVRPPAIYRPTITIGAPGVYRPGVTVTAPHWGVGAPPARVVVPAPRVYAPGVRVGVPGPRVYTPTPAPRAYAPAPAPHVYTPTPAPRAYAPAPAPRVYTPTPAPRAYAPAPAPAPAPVYRRPTPAPAPAPSRAPVPNVRHR